MSDVTARHYIRPVGRAASTPAGAEPSLAVAGRPDLLFAAAQCVERDGDAIQRRMATAGALLSGVQPEAAGKPCSSACRRRGLPLPGSPSYCPRIMGVVNVTPDSFSDGGRYLGA